MSEYPYTHFEIMSQLNEAIYKLETNSKVFTERLEKLEAGSTTNHLYQSEKVKINQIINGLDSLTAELGSIEWIQ